MPDRSPSVAFDVTSLVGPRTGIGRAVAESFTALMRLPGGPALIPYALGKAVLRAREALPPGSKVVPLPTRAVLWAWSRWDQPRLDRVFRPAQVVHATSFTAPPSRLPVVVTVHDCTFARFPDSVPQGVRWFAPLLRRAVARGTWVHCTTETIAAEFDELFGPGLRSAGRLVVIPFGIPELGPPGRLAPRVVRQIGGSPYVLALGTLTPRKNLPRLVVAFGVIAGRHPTLRLVLAGPDGLDRPAVQAAISSLDPTVAQRVVITGEVDEQTRRALIEGAAVMAYPSAYEGFGFPILEAMTLRVPVLAADAGALREVADGSAHLVDPLDVQSIAAGLDLLMTDASLREELIERGTRRATAFSWRRTARELRAVYEELAGRSARISL